MPIVAIKDVAGLEIAMRDATGMCVRQPARDRQSDLSDLRPRKWRVGRTADERATTAVLLHEKWCGWRVIEVEHLHDVRVPQLGECRGFAAKALVCTLISGNPRMQHLDRHNAVESKVARPKHLTCTTTPKRRLEAVAAAEIRHRRFLRGRRKAVILGQDPQVGCRVAVGRAGIRRVDALDCLEVSFERHACSTHDLVVLCDGLGRHTFATRPTTIGAAQIDFPEVVTKPAPLDGLHQLRWAFAARLERRVGISGKSFGAIHLPKGYVAARTDPVCAPDRPKVGILRRGPPSASGLGHRPFTAATRVRIPLGVL